MLKYRLHNTWVYFSRGSLSWLGHVDLVVGEQHVCGGDGLESKVVAVYGLKFGSQWTDCLCSCERECFPIPTPCLSHIHTHLTGRAKQPVSEIVTVDDKFKLSSHLIIPIFHAF